MTSKGPVFVQEMRDVSEIEKSAATFVVKIKGDKPITVKWSDEDGPLDIDGVLICADDDEEEGVYMLSITDVDFETHSGLYRCEANNKHGTTISEATLYVEEMPETAKTLVDKVQHKD